MNTHRTLLSVSTAFLIGLTLCAVAPPARAAIEWSGDVDPANPATWTSSTYGYIGKTADGSMTIDAGSGVIDDYGYLGYNSGVTGTATVTGTGSTWTNSKYLFVGYSGSGVLNITGGGAVSNYNHGGVIADRSGSTGVVTVDGAGSTWTNGSFFVVGVNGSGTLNITAAGAVSSSYSYIGIGSGSTGVVTVDGASSTWTNTRFLKVGDEGTGTLNIQNGGAVSSAGETYVGNRFGSTGVVTVDGAGSTWTNSSYLYVGNYGSATLDISGGGVVTVERDTWVGWSSSSSATINFDNGTLTTGGLLCASDDLTGTGTINTGGLVSDVDLVFDATHGLEQTFSINDNPGQNITINLNVDGSGAMGAGYSAVGTMSISDGIVIESTRGHIGDNSGSTGVVTVDGAGSTWTNGSTLFIGNSGSGVLNITGGGAVSNRYGYIGPSSGSTGVVTVDGASSTWTNTRFLKVGDEGTGTGSGTLNIENGGAVTVGGDLNINSLSTLDIILASLTDPLLDVAGNASLDGTLSVDLADGFGLNKGDLFTLIDLTDIHKTITGTFIGLAQGDSVGNFGGIDLFISYAGGDGNDVTLFTAAGDVNLNGFVDGDDLNTITTNWGQSLGREFGDLNGNGIVDGPDYTEVLSYWKPQLFLPGDVDGNGWIDGTDLSIVIDNWGQSLGREFGDLNGNGVVDGPDYTEVLSYWYPEPPSEATPEPATLGLVVVGGLVLVKRRR